MPNKKHSYLVSIFITAFIDMLGIGIIIPIIPAIFYSKAAIHFTSIDTATEIRWVYCTLMASFSFMQFFGAPILGSLSDKYGRKKIIQISLIGTAIGYALFGFSIQYNSLILMYLSRIIPGFFGGSLSVLFSSISDISSPEDKPKNFALIGMAFGLGFIFGPIIGGILSDNTVLSWFTLSTPFIFTTCLALLNFVLVYFRFEETLKNKIQSKKIKFYKGFLNVHTAFSTLNLRVLFLITFLTTLGFSFFTQFFSVIMFEKFEVSPKMIGLIFGWVGLWLIFTQGFLIRKINKYFSSESIISVTMLTLGMAIIALIIPNAIIGILICNVFIAVSQGLNSPNLLTIVSKQANAEQQGEIMGINQSMQSLAQFIPPMIVAIFGEELLTFPFLFGGSLIIIAWAVFLFIFRKKQND